LKDPDSWNLQKTKAMLLNFSMMKGLEAKNDEDLPYGLVLIDHSKTKAYRVGLQGEMGKFISKIVTLVAKNDRGLVTLEVNYLHDREADFETFRMSLSIDAQIVFFSESWYADLNGDSKAKLRHIAGETGDASINGILFEIFVKLLLVVGKICPNGRLFVGASEFVMSMCHTWYDVKPHFQKKRPIRTIPVYSP
jgi:hypothetical protein